MDNRTKRTDTSTAQNGRQAATIPSLTHSDYRPWHRTTSKSASFIICLPIYSLAILLHV